VSVVAGELVAEGDFISRFPFIRDAIPGGCQHSRARATPAARRGRCVGSLARLGSKTDKVRPLTPKNYRVVSPSVKEKFLKT
jgi:hypothetical protein